MSNIAVALKSPTAKQVGRILSYVLPILATALITFFSVNAYNDHKITQISEQFKAELDALGNSIEDLTASNVAQLDKIERIETITSSLDTLNQADVSTLAGMKTVLSGMRAAWAAIRAEISH
jgi:hypothetical protein